MNKTLKYISPAKSFTEALPLGNGSLGAMVYGGVPEEKITLNYDTFWSGTGHREEKEIDSSTLEQARKLIFEEKFWEAEEYMKKNMLGFYNESYMPLGILSYVFEKVDEPKEYVRFLDLENAIFTSKFKNHETEYISKMFISNPAKALVIKITANGMDKLDLKVKNYRSECMFKEYNGGRKRSANHLSVVRDNRRWDSNLTGTSNGKFRTLRFYGRKIRTRRRESSYVSV